MEKWLIAALIGGALAWVVLSSPGRAAQEGKDKEAKVKDYDVSMSEEEWRKKLTPEEYYILRQKGTERAFTGEFYKHKGEGTYTCAGCGNELFSSDTKYESGSGWPSFYQPIGEGKVEEKRDSSHGMIRTEVMCNACGGHLGHVFNDGPAPTRLRYCINSVSLDFENEDKDKDKDQK